DSPELYALGSPIVENGKLALGNLDIERDWGHARDFVRAMWLILQQSEAADYVVGTGVLHTLRDLCELAYRHVGLNWRDHVVTNAQLARPLETVCTVADPARAHASLGWSPALGFDEMVQDMVNAQIRRLRAVME
ncbi:MAG: GDP-mannose 4,6-dehydratase, partial [Pseudomonadales bacterium]